MNESITSWVDCWKQLNKKKKELESLYSNVKVVIEPAKQLTILKLEYEITKLVVEFNKEWKVIHHSRDGRANRKAIREELPIKILKDKEWKRT